MTVTDTPAIDEAKPEAFVGRRWLTWAQPSPGCCTSGDRLGLYKATAGAGPVTSDTLARRTGTTERYVGEWPGNPDQAIGVLFAPPPNAATPIAFTGGDPFSWAA